MPIPRRAALSGTSVQSILVTNDDGVRSLGLQALAEALRPDFRVVIVAPQEDQSGSSHGLTVSRPLRLDKLGEDHYSVNGRPADCVKLAVSDHLGGAESFAAVVAGIN